MTAGSDIKRRKTDDHTATNIIKMHRKRNKRGDWISKINESVTCVIYKGRSITLLPDHTIWLIKTDCCYYWKPMNRAAWETIIYSEAKNKSVVNVWLYQPDNQWWFIIVSAKSNSFHKLACFRTELQKKGLLRNLSSCNNPFDTSDNYKLRTNQ